jgi:hypothetical protein
MRLRYHEWRQRLARLLQRAKDEGDVAPGVNIAQAAEALVALIDGIGVEVLLGVQHIPAARQRAMFELWLDTVRSNPIATKKAAAAKPVSARKPAQAKSAPS